MGDLELQHPFNDSDIPPEALARITTYVHPNENGRLLIVSTGLVIFDYREALDRWFSIRKWQSMSVGVQGSLKARLADQANIGRLRNPGERTPAPLPDWYDLTHLVYQHGVELGFDPTRDVYQVLSRPDENYVNIAEALHVRQPK